MGKTGRGVGDYWVKPGDWEMGDHVNEVCSFDSKLQLVKINLLETGLRMLSFVGCYSGCIF